MPMISGRTYGKPLICFINVSFYDKFIIVLIYFQLLLSITELMDSFLKPSSLIDNIGFCI